MVLDNLLGPLGPILNYGPQNFKRRVHSVINELQILFCYPEIYANQNIAHKLSKILI